MRPTSFLPALLAARPRLRGHIDGIAIHPYGNPLVTLSRIRSARVTIAALGPTALGHLNCGVAAAVLYTWVSPERNPDDGQEWYGINGVDGTATSDVAAFVAGLRAARSPRPAISVCAF